MKNKLQKPKPKPFPARLRFRRSFLRLTQAQAAARLGVPVRTFEKWEIGAMLPDPFKQTALLEKLK